MPVCLHVRTPKSGGCVSQDLAASRGHLTHTHLFAYLLDYMWLWGTRVFSYHLDPGDQTQDVRLGSKRYPLSRLASPLMGF